MPYESPTGTNLAQSVPQGGSRAVAALRGAEEITEQKHGRKDNQHALQQRALCSCEAMRCIWRLDIKGIEMCTRMSVCLSYSGLCKCLHSMFSP